MSRRAERRRAVRDAGRGEAIAAGEAVAAGEATTADEAELILDARSELGEGPVWDATADELLWVDILGRRVHRYRPADGSSRTFETPSPVGAVATRSNGGLVLALEDGFWLQDPGDDRLRRLAAVESDVPGNRMNDGKVDRAGRFWAGTMAYDGTPGTGSLYRLEPDGHVTRVLRGVTTSNGLGWSPDGRVMYYIDTPTQRVDAFDYDEESGEISHRRPLVEIPAEAGSPDGMTVDSEGFLWVALWGGWAVHRYSPDGRLDVSIRLPVSQVSSCTFGGDGLRELYITSAATGLAEDALGAQPHAGSLFRSRLDVAGLPAHAFGG
jgi:sugar lactone lactonase YvrE